MTDRGPEPIAKEVRSRLPRDLLQVVDDFYDRYLERQP